jgi:hypothetical protein
MRTTVVIDDDVLSTAKAIARQNHQPLGKVISELARKALHPPASVGERNGLPLLARRTPGAVVTQESVNALRDEPA